MAQYLHTDFEPHKLRLELVYFCRIVVLDCILHYMMFLCPPPVVWSSLNVAVKIHSRYTVFPLVSVCVAECVSVSWSVWVDGTCTQHVLKRRELAGHGSRQGQVLALGMVAQNNMPSGQTSAGFQLRA